MNKIKYKIKINKYRTNIIKKNRILKKQIKGRG